MARARQTLRAVLSAYTIIELNRQQIERFGGGWHPTPDNLQNPGTLYHVLEEIRGSVFDKELYSTILEKAAILSYRIMSGHVFFDGNKRTGMAACELFLGLNGYIMDIDIEETIPVALRVADRQDMKYEEYLSWLRGKIIYSWTFRFLIGLELRFFMLIGRLARPPSNEPIEL
jgi:death-on-curing protein